MSTYYVRVEGKVVVTDVIRHSEGCRDTAEAAVGLSPR